STIIVSGGAPQIDIAAHKGALDEAEHIEKSFGERRCATMAVNPWTTEKGIFRRVPKTREVEQMLYTYGALVANERGRRPKGKRLKYWFRRDGVTTALSDIVVAVETRDEKSGTADTGLRSILQGVPLVVVNWDNINSGQERALADGEKFLLQQQIKNRLTPRCFPESPILIPDSEDAQNILSSYWHAFLDEMIRNPGAGSCREERLRKLGSRVALPGTQANHALALAPVGMGIVETTIIYFLIGAALIFFLTRRTKQDNILYGVMI
ncbi:unnamed protein product, partial [marine sediment metagenome]